MTAPTWDRGPYINEGHDEVYMPVSEWAYNDARSEAAEYAEDMIGDWGRSHYDGKRNVRLHDHDDWEECEACPLEPAWTFSTYEGTYRG